MSAWRRWLLALATGAAVLTGAPQSVQAWDPSTTHLGMLERSVLDSAMHLRMMEGSLLQRGLFTPLRLDPERLDDDTRRTLLLALRRVHAASGADALGGPGACPSASAPASTRVRCVEGDLWEMTAMGWLELGVITETVPAERLLHHFVDRDEPSALRWTDDDLSRVVLRGKHAKVGATVAERAAGSSFEGSGRSAIAWLSDAEDPWAPPALARHLRRASLAATAAERDHHLALAMLCTGALLHVVQDLSVPAHARGDVTAMFLPLSELEGDRGLPLQELARVAYGRAGLPQPVTLGPRAEAATRGIAWATTLEGHLLGEGDREGLVRQSAGHYFSESSLPKAQRLTADLDGEAAAKRLLQGIPLDPAEREGARLAPWPADRGYLVGGSGQLLAAFRVDEQEVVHLWLDRRVYRTQMQRLIPAGVDAGRSVLDLVYAGFPEVRVDAAARTVVLHPETTWQGATLRVMLQDGAGQRTPVSTVALTSPEPHRVVDAWSATRPAGTRVVLVIENPAGQLPAIAEHVIDPDAPVQADDAPASTVPRPRAQPPTTRPGAGRPTVGGPGKVAADPVVPDEAAPTEEIDDAAADDTDADDEPND